MTDHMFSGKISKISSDGRFGVVTLDKSIAGLKLAVITPDTKGRMQLMNGVGHLEVDTRVSGTGVEGPDSMRVLSVEES